MTEDKQPEVPEKKHALDVIAEKLKSKQEPKVTEPSVRIMELQLDAIQKLADNSNEVFSELSVQETRDVSLALAFADNPLPDINKKLKVEGIDYEIKLPVLEKFIELQLMYRHSTDRKRVEEFIRALKAMNPTIHAEEEKKPGILGKKWI